MAGLDTRGAFDGFTQGFGMMQNFQDSKDRKAYMKDQQGMQQRGLEMREQEFSAQQEQRQKQNDQQYITQFWGRASPLLEAGQDDPEALKQLQGMFEDEEAKSVFSRNKLANPLHILNPKTVSAASYADKLAAGEGQLFSEETAQAMNDYFSPEVNRMPGRKTRIAGVYPGQNPEAMVFDLGVTPTGGLKGVEQPEYNSPMTVNRGIAGEDDEIMEVPIEEMIKRVQGARMIYQDLGPERLQRAQASLRAMGYLPAKWEQVQGPGGSILQRNTKTGELKNVLGRAPQQISPTSQQKNYLFLRDTLNLSDEEAYQAAFGGTSAVNERVSGKVTAGISLLNAQIKEIDSKIVGKNGLLLPKEDLAMLTQKRDELAEQRSALAQSSGLLAKPQESEQQQALQPGHTGGGLEFMGGDPADIASWSRQAPASKGAAGREAPVTTASEVDQQMRDFKSQQKTGAPAANSDVDHQIRELKLW